MSFLGTKHDFDQIAEDEAKKAIDTDPTEALNTLLEITKENPGINHKHSLKMVTEARRDNAIKAKTRKVKVNRETETATCRACGTVYDYSKGFNMIIVPDDFDPRALQDDCPCPYDLAPAYTNEKPKAKPEPAEPDLKDFGAF